MDINTIWDDSKTRFEFLKNLKIITLILGIKIRFLNGYDAIREKLDENNTLTVKQPAVNEEPKTKVSTGLN